MFHFMNCFLLAFAPYWVVYRSTKLSEESALRSCVTSGFGYAATQCVKIFIMATMMPSFAEAGTFSLPQEILRTLVQAVDILGVQFTMGYAPNLSKFDPKTRVLAVATGWALFESLAQFLLPLWIGARGMEFSWEYIEMGIDSNVNLLRVLAFVGVGWLRLRTDLDKSALPVLLGIVAAYVTQPALMSYLELVAGLSSWNLLLIRGAIAAVCAFLSNALLNRYLAAKSARN